MPPRNLAEPQFGNATLTRAEAESACGPIAAAGFARAYGRNPTAREALDLAFRQNLISLETGMRGPAAEQALLREMGIQTELTGPDWSRAQRHLASGQPVIFDTPGHYFLAEAYDPSTGAYYVGNTGAALRVGSDWMTPEQMGAAMGSVRNMLFGAPGAPSGGGNTMPDYTVQQAVNAIAAGRSQGKGDDIITNSLLQAGFPEQTVVQAFAHIAAGGRAQSDVPGWDWIQDRLNPGPQYGAPEVGDTQGAPGGPPTEPAGPQRTSTPLGNGRYQVREEWPDGRIVHYTLEVDGRRTNIEVWTPNLDITTKYTRPYDIYKVDDPASATSTTTTSSLKELDAALAAGAITSEQYNEALRNLALPRDPNAMTPYQAASLAQNAQTHADTLRQQAIANARAQAQLDWQIQQFGMTFARQLEQDRLKAEADALDREWEQVKWQTQRPGIEATTEATRASTWNTLFQSPYEFERRQAVAERAQDLSEQATAINYAKTGDPLAYLAMIRGQGAPGLSGSEIWQGVRRSVPELPMGNLGAPGFPANRYGLAPTTAGVTSGGLTTGAPGLPPDAYAESQRVGYGQYGPPGMQGQPVTQPVSLNALPPFAAPQAPGAIGAVLAGRPITAPGRLPAGTIPVPGVQSQRNMSPYELATLRTTAEYQGVPGADWDDALSRARRAVGPGLAGRGYAGTGVRAYG